MAWRTEGGGDLGLAPHPRTYEEPRHRDYTPGPGQRNFRGIQTEDQIDEHDLPTSPARLSLMQLCREGVSDMEVSLHWIDGQDGSGFPIQPMVPGHTTGGKAFTNPQTVQCEPKDIRLWTCL